MPDIVMQNGQYDTVWLYEVLGIKPRGYCHDTMLLHHSLYPELPKSLEFMILLYADTVDNSKTLNRAEKKDA